MLIHVTLALVCTLGITDDSTPPAQSLFNGRDLSGWVNVNGAPSTWSVGRDEAGNPVIVCTGKPISVLRSERMYENFILELEYAHRVPRGNSGLFIWSDPLTARGQPFTRSIEVQVMDGVEATAEIDGRTQVIYTSEGDIFSIHGASMTPDRPHPAGWERCLPNAARTKPAPEWNHYRVVADRGRVTLEVNGAEVSGAGDCSPRKGYICLEAEGSEIWFRNITLRELPSAGALSPEQVAREGEDFRPLYTGVDLAGWKADEQAAEHWRVRDWILSYDGRGGDLWTEEEFGDFELICDWRWTGDSQGLMQRPLIGPDGLELRDATGAVRTVEVGERDSGIYLRGSPKSQVNIWTWPAGSGEVWGYRTDASQPAEVRAACTPREAADRKVGEWNRFRIRMEGELLNVWLNDRHVIADAPLPDVPAKGPIGLQHHGSSIDFANIFIRPLR